VSDFAKITGDDYQAMPIGTELDLSILGILITGRRVAGGWELFSTAPVPSRVVARGWSRARSKPASPRRKPASPASHLAAMSRIAAASKQSP
jgi:hypothetical protein